LMANNILIHLPSFPCAKPGPAPMEFFVRLYCSSEFSYNERLAAQ
jgi:hypothetical protein